ncbi:hypothetical protein H310_14994 [Aphanomyces invadans]|uniref:Uncharacterized protein n=1 Tax=Aphanomyces invadans TaxID=157072 RepID=A0A024T8A1_9STRA|nr:hypothetical protein H310_14994 [Aphanomyces invadans]ETV90174.1 hypothetical protein H310_14994 [Aphanomyces invadans]|eukprot:XP_008881193.1 hypothetical protein H310_14994 [Aphanomyces invadans]
MHMITFMKTYHPTWLEDYKAAKKDAYKSLLKLCQDFAKRLNLFLSACHKFWNKYYAYEPCGIPNVDETAVIYVMPPGRIWAEKGQSSRVDKKQKHSDRLTAPFEQYDFPIIFS